LGAKDRDLKSPRAAPGLKMNRRKGESMKSNRKWATVGWLAAMQLFGKVKKNAFDIAQIYGATAYLKGVLMVREFFLYQIGLLVCVLLLVFGGILMEVAAVFYIPAETSTRVLLCFTLGGVNFLIGVIVLGYFSSSKRWLRQASKYNALLKAVMEEKDF
jgi:hypothetical protein